MDVSIASTRLRLTSSVRGCPADIFATLSAGCKSSPSMKGTPSAFASASPTVDFLCTRRKSQLRQTRGHSEVCEAVTQLGGAGMSGWLDRKRPGLGRRREEELTRIQKCPCR